MSFLNDYNELIELSEYITVAELIAHGVDFSKPDDSGLYPLQPVCKELRIQFVIDLIEAGADVNSKDSCGFTPLLAAIECSHFDPESALKIIQVLLDHGADIEGRGEWDITPFLKSCTRGQISITEYLINRNCDIHATANEIGGPMDALEFCDMQSNSLEFQRYIKSLYAS